MDLKKPKRPKWDEFVHLHNDKIIDRNLLTRQQHEDLLSTPRPAFGPPPAPPRGKRNPCKIPKICPPRIDQLALPTIKLMEGVLEHFNQTLEPLRIVRLVKLIHTKETERPLYSAKPKKKEPCKKKKKNRARKKECLKVWLKKQSRKSSKLIVNTLRERKAAVPNYRQLLVALGLMKAMKIKKKKHLPRYTKQYLMKICEQMAIICDTEWTPYKKLPEIPEAIPLEPVESEVSRRHIFWKLRPLEEEEELEIEMEAEEEEIVEEEEAEEIEAYIKTEPEEVVFKEELVSIKEEGPSITEMGEESTYEEEYPDYERELKKELEGYDEAKEADETTDFTTDEEEQMRTEKQKAKDLDEESIQDKEKAQREEKIQDGEEALSKEMRQREEDEGKSVKEDRVKEELQDKEEIRDGEKVPGKEGRDEEKQRGKEEGSVEEKLQGQEAREEEKLQDKQAPGEEKLQDKQAPGEEKLEVKKEDRAEEKDGAEKKLPGEKESQKGEEVAKGEVSPTAKEGETPTTGEITDEIEGGIKSEGGATTEEGERDTVAPEDSDFEPVTEEEGMAEIKEEFIETEIKDEIMEEEEGEEEEEREEEERVEEEEVEEEEVKEEEEEEIEEEKEKMEKVEAPPAEIVEEHPPNTVSYLSWNIYSHWLEEFGRNIQIYGKCLNNFKVILEDGTNVQGDKIRIILANWGTYLKESMQFEKNMTNYFMGKTMTKCAKCGDYTLYNIPTDHEIPDELKQAATSTGRWKKLLEEAEELCRSFAVVAEDTVSLISHESIDITDSIAATTSETSMYVVEDYFPSRR